MKVFVLFVCSTFTRSYIFVIREIVWYIKIFCVMFKFVNVFWVVIRKFKCVLKLLVKLMLLMKFMIKFLVLVCDFFEFMSSISSCIVFAVFSRVCKYMGFEMDLVFDLYFRRVVLNFILVLLFNILLRYMYYFKEMR